MTKYTYIGKELISLSPLGEIKPGSVIESETEINHPLFVKVTKSEGKRIAEQSREK